jgi:hypothetical protein
LEIVMKSLAVLATALVCALASGVSAVAQPTNDRPVGPVVGEGQAPLSRVQVINGIEVINGGANIADANYMKSRTGEFGLRFVFSGRGGEYGVAERLTLRDGSREVVSIKDAGPHLLVKLPPGRYSAEATFKGVVETRTVVVGSGSSVVSWNTLRASD